MSSENRTSLEKENRFPNRMPGEFASSVVPRKNEPFRRLKQGKQGVNVDLCLGMDCIVSKLVRRGKIWDFDNGMSFDTGKGGRNCKKREALWMSHKPSLLEQPR